MRNTIIVLGIFLTAFFITPSSVFAAPLTVDPTFVTGTGFTGSSRHLFMVENNTKYLFTGQFTAYNGTPVNRILKLNLDGSIDTAFLANIGTGITGTINGTSVQPDGKILVALNPGFSFNGVSYPGGLLRLNENGTVDSAFMTAIGTSSSDTNGNRGLLGAKALSTGTILAMGSNYTLFNGATANRIFALNANGTANTSFNANLATGVWIQAGLVQLYEATELSNGQIVISGANSTGRSGIFRLNADGSLDNTFNSGGTGTNAGVWDHHVFPDGKIAMVGQFTTYNGVSTPRVALLNSDGTVDTNFIVGTGFAANTPLGVLPLPSGAFLVGVSPATTYKGVSAPFMIGINRDGSAPAVDLGTGFNSSTTYNSSVIDPNGKLVIATVATVYNGTNVINGLVRFAEDFTPPSISNVSIASNNTNTAYAKTGDIVTLSFTSNDAVTGSTVTIGGEAVTPSCSGTAPSVQCSASLTITGGVPASEGIVSFSIVLTSAGGTSSAVTATTNSSSVTVDRVAPTPAITTPANGATVGVQIPSISGTCESGFSVVLTAVGTNPNTETVNCTGGVFATTIPVYTIGTPTITIQQTDTAGNIGTATATYVQDIAPPTVTITSPTIAVSLGGATVSGTCEDGLTVTLTGFGFNGTTTSCTGGTYNTTITVTGSLFLVVSQTDAVGNTGSAQFSSGGGALLLPSVTQQNVPARSSQAPQQGAKKTFTSPVDGTLQTCPGFSIYLIPNSRANNPEAVRLWQAFLNTTQKESIPLTGYFGPKTFAAVKRFQTTYAKEILAPWGLTRPTGRVYQSTRAKANQLIGCSEGTITLDNGATITQ